MRESRKTFGEFDWEESSLLKLVRKRPRILCEPRLDDSSLDTLVHVAAREGCSQFLDHVLIFDTLERAWVSMVACLMKNKKGKTPLIEAMESRSRASVAAILRTYGEILSAKHVMPKGEHQRGARRAEKTRFGCAH